MTLPIQVHFEPLQALLALGEDIDERTLLVAATEAVVRLLGERGSCVLIDGAPRIVISTQAPSLTNWPIDLARYPELITALAGRTVLWIPDVHQDPLLASVRSMLPPELRSVAVVPLVAGEQRLGALMVQSQTSPIPDASALATAALIGQLAGRMLVHARARRELVRASDPEIPDPVAVAPDSTSLPAQTSGTARRILIIEDDADLSEAVGELLQGAGYVIDRALDGSEGLARAREHVPDLILLDVMMPVLDGFATAGLLRKDVLTCDVPILFLSAAGDPMARVHGLKLGATDFLCKPYHPRELLARIERSMQQLATRERLRHDAFTDELTGLGNTRLLQERMLVEQSRGERHGTSLGFAVIDVDGLKKINDQHGHAAGSAVLATIGAVLRAGVRDTDVAVRYGGDEFVVLLPHATVVEALAFAHRVLARLAEERPFGLKVTVSIGVAASLGGADRSLTHLFEQADAAAYKAKRAGGDRVCAFEPAPAPAPVPATEPATG